MSRRTYILVAVLFGIVTGFVTIHSFFAHSWASIFLWIAVGVALLAFSGDRKSALYGGALFGFFTIAVWLVTGFQGTPDKLFGFALLSLALSILGALCGMLGAVVFYRLFRSRG